MHSARHNLLAAQLYSTQLRYYCPSEQPSTRLLAYDKLLLIFR